MTPLELAWREFVARVPGAINPDNDTPALFFAQTREAFEAGFAAGAAIAVDRLCDVLEAQRGK